MKAKLTRNPVHDGHIGFGVVSRSRRDLEEKLRSIHDMAVGIQGFTLMFLPMDLALGVKLGSEI